MSRFPGIWEFPGPEIRILREISSPEPAGNVIVPAIWGIFPGNFLDFCLWSWKVLKPVPLSDITSKGRDDRALALYITFPYDPETASLAEKLLRPAVELIEGKKAAGRMLSYIWVGHGNPGDLYQSPFYGEVNAMIIKRNASDPLDKWLNEQVNVVEDYQKAFGSKPKEILELLIGADTDDLAGSSIGLVKNLNIKSE